YLDGQAAVIHELIAGFATKTRAVDAELAAVAAGDELANGSLDDAERYLDLAERGLASVPEGRQGQARLPVGVGRLLLARQARGPAGSGRRSGPTAGHGGEAGGGPARSERGVARAGVDQPRRRRVLGGQVRGRRTVPGSGHRAGAADRAALSGVHRPGLCGSDRVLRVGLPRGETRQT